MAMIAFACVCAALMLTLLAAMEDVRRYTISNWIPAALIGLWCVYAPVSGMGWTAAGLALATGFGALVLTMALWAPGWLGGGDAKLLAALALWFGWPSALTFVLLAVISGGVLALGLLMLRRYAPGLPVSPAWIASGPLAHGAPVPYGVAIAAGTFWALPGSALFSSLIL